MLNSKQVDKAIALGKLGFKVIPLKTNDKYPLFKEYKLKASCDEQDIIDMFQTKYNADGSTESTRGPMPYNIGIITDDICLIDIDNKNGANGNKSYANIFKDANEELFKLSSTNVVKTPNEGFHVYFRNPNGLYTKPSVNVIANGIDTKGYNNCIVAPGSIVNGVEYDGEYFTKNFDKLSTVPNAIKNLLIKHHKLVSYSEINERNLAKVNDTFANFDLEENVDRAIKYLQKQEGSMPGEHQNKMFAICAYLKDLGISQDKIVELVMEHYADRCYPPQDLARVEKCAESAYLYARNATGSASGLNDFDNVDLFFLEENSEEPKKEDESDIEDVELDLSEIEGFTHVEEPKTTKKPIFEFGNAKSLDQIPPRPWIVKDLLLGGSLTVGSAAGSTGKTTMLLEIACGLSSGQSEILGFNNVFAGKQVKSLIHSCEDDIDELSRRINGYCIEYGLDFDKVKSNIALSSGKNNRLVFATQDRSGALKEGTDAINAIYEMCKEQAIGFIGLDPLANLHECNENDSIAMTFTMSIFNKIADKTGASVCVMHHTAKSSDGSVNGSRGSSSINNSARIGFMINTVSEEEAKKLGIPEEDAPRISYIGEGKTNVSAKTGRKKWYYMKSVKINEEFTGIHTIYDITQIQEMLRNGDLGTIEGLIPANSNRVSVKKVCDTLKLKPHHIKKQVKELQEYVLNIVGNCDYMYVKSDYVYVDAQTHIPDDIEAIVDNNVSLEEPIEVVSGLQEPASTTKKPNLVKKVETKKVVEEVTPKVENDFEEVTFNIPDFEF